MSAVDEQFKNLVDELVIKSVDDIELAEGLRWVDKQAFKSGIGFYEMALMIMRKHMAERRAKEWLRDKIE